MWPSDKDGLAVGRIAYVSWPSGSLAKVSKGFRLAGYGRRRTPRPTLVAPEGDVLLDGAVRDEVVSTLMTP